jgi:hypothetical protein
MLGMFIRALMATCGLWMIVALVVLPVGAEVASATDQIQEKTVGLGVACRLPGRAWGVPSYALADLTKSGTPMVSGGDLQITAAIANFDHSKSLRVAMIGSSLVVFDATAGACFGGSPGYWALNGSCNDFYSPVDGEHPMPGPCYNTRRPWMPADDANGNVPWQHYNEVVIPTP